ncbi:MAG: sulfotransferase [Desulfohalobiaceae bacterium]|nr:sulfotransferase [Desulfohalobiaceae bacterium]
MSLIQRLHRFCREYAGSLHQGLRYRARFEGLERYCMFLGYPRSGHSLVGSLLDAHPEAVIAHELDALKYLKRGFSRNQVYHLLAANSEHFAATGRNWTGYSYSVPKQWQGQTTRLRVIGDKKGGKSTRDIGFRPDLLDLLLRKIPLPVKFIHVVRNPFDNISKIKQKNVPDIICPILDHLGLDLDPNGLEAAVQAYLFLCRTVETVKKRVEPGNWLDISQESLIRDPEERLREICGFLELDAPRDYLRDCAGIVFRSPRKVRHECDWDQGLIDEVQAAMQGLSFGAGYAFANDE